MLLTISRLKKWEHEQNVPRLIEALQTEDDDLRQAICLILGKIHSADALLALRYISKQDSNEFVKIAAVNSIENIIDKIDFSTETSYETRQNYQDLSPVFAIS